ncbi:uncharacterized protein LOC129589551 [Paramacrobiotus metropolitanus]|uniref:uncharacterized protein LOC129589551 n=1 Tax=Paramacrobiotus metropolitanus TaxID=2943436 RepID=UPI002445F51A|nr:uncharacterized protein LOC129589551 [Paramacrobiotus metropolitanus]XP_055340323.1 uncharacterized protein LOC129589551 [Paramacrobiotus metropolitanus]
MVEYWSLFYLIIAPLLLNTAKAVSDEDGDVLITTDIFQTPGNVSDGNARGDTGPALWPTRTAIPYIISPLFSLPEQLTILKALRIMERKTRGCVMFKPKSDENDYIFFSANTYGKCDSQVGRSGGLQYIHLAHPGDYSSTSCMDTGSIQHEVMHTLGFRHEQKRPDREQYVDVRSDNIDDETADNDFAISSLMFTYGIKYDYHSILHYEAFAGALSPQVPVIVPKRGLIVRMGLELQMTPSDVAKIILAYQCPLVISPGSTTGKSENFPNFSLDPMTEDQCQQQFNKYCGSDLTMWNNCTRRKDLRIRCLSNAPLSVLERMAVNLAKEPLRLASMEVEERLLAIYSFKPIQTQVLKLQLCNCFTARVTRRLITLNFENLIHFELYHCHNLIIEKADFTMYQRLRIITFYNTTVNALQSGSFADLPELRILSLEALSNSQKNYNFEPTFREYLQRLHCSCEFAWYRSWWRNSKALRLRVQTGELYSFEGPSEGTFFNSDPFIKEDLYHPINCHADPFPLSTEWINYYTQIEYSVNEPLCNQTSATSSAAKLSTRLVTPATTSAPSPAANGSEPTHLAVTQSKLNPGSVTGIVIGVLMGMALLIAAISAFIMKNRCRAWQATLRNDGLSGRLVRNGGTDAGEGIAFGDATTP